MTMRAGVRLVFICSEDFDEPVRDVLATILAIRHTENTSAKCIIYEQAFARPSLPWIVHSDWHMMNQIVPIGTVEYVFPFRVQNPRSRCEPRWTGLTGIGKYNQSGDHPMVIEALRMDMPNQDDPRNGMTTDRPAVTDHTQNTEETPSDEGVDTREEAVIQRARMLSDLLDEAFRVPGTNFRVGLDPILGILPGAGDVLAAAIALYPVFEAYRLDRPTSTIMTMLTLIAIDTIIGAIPIVGPVFDSFWKANKWNVRILENSQPTSSTI